MLRRLVCFTVSALLILTGAAPGWADSYQIDTDSPTDPISIDAEFVRISVIYDEAADLTRYTLTLKDEAPVTIDDVLFTLYARLDPGCTGPEKLSALRIPGLRAYRLRLTEEQISAGQALMEAIREAPDSYEPTEEDGWTEETRLLYRTLADECAAAHEREFPELARRIVDYCAANLPIGFDGALDRSAEELLSDDGLKVAYSMFRWGYATYKSGRLTATRSRTVYDLDGGIYPSLTDFTDELRLVYSNDFAACWAIECPNPKLYDPVLPDLEASFLTALYKDEQTAVSSVTGIRVIDGVSLEICLTGVDMRSDDALFAMPMLTLADCGDASMWDPENGLYGHPFGDVSGIPDAEGVRIYTPATDPFYTMD